MMLPPKVIIDTDAGTDDAVAILMVLEAHRRGQVEVVAITTVNGNTSTHNVNKNVLRILHITNLTQIPVYSGAESPLVHKFNNPKAQPNMVPFHGFDGFGDAGLPPLPPSLAPQPQHAVWQMLQLARKHPKQVCLLALAPLTNVALAVRLDPNFTSQLAAIYAMGGNTTGEGNTSVAGEFNFLADPEAAKVVLENCSVPVHLVPWELCLYGVNLTYADRAELGKTQTPAAELINNIEKKILNVEEFDTWVNCDQLAAACLIHSLKQLHRQNSVEEGEQEDEEPLVTDTITCYGTIETQGTLTRGQMVLDKKGYLKKKPNVVMITAVNKRCFKRYLTMAFGGEF